MLNSRDSARSGFRKVAYSTDGGITYGPVTLDRELPDPANNASVVRAFPNAPEGSNEAKVLLFSNAASTSSRVNGTVRVSCDDGETWPVAKTYAPGAHAYSTLATLPDGNVGVLYEPGHNGLVFAKFNLAWVQGLCAPITAASDLTIERGTEASTDLSVTNQLGPILKGATLTAEAPEGWTVTPADASLTLRPKQTSSTSVTVAVPASATGGTYAIPVRLTDAAGRSSVGTITVVVPKNADDKDGLISVSSRFVNPKEAPYAVGDVLRFEYRVRNLTDAVTTVVPSGNLQGFDPADGAPNCRWRNLPGKGAYTCSSAYHTVTDADLSTGSFTPRTTWVSTAVTGDVTTVRLDGPAVPLG
jgi:sialidase-1